MKNYEVKIIEKGDVLETIIAGITVAKALQLETLYVDFKEGFSILVRKDSSYIDIMSIHRLTVDNMKLKKTNQ
jgi:hypothetical protein